MKLVTRICAKLEHQNHCHYYVIKFKFRDIGTLYCVNISINSVKDELLLILNTFYKRSNYFVECEIVRDIQVPVSSNYYQVLKSKLKSDLYKFKDIKFLNSKSFYNNPLELFDKLLPVIDYSKYDYQQFLPKWGYHSDEIKELTKNIVSFDKIGYIVEKNYISNPFL